jgi:5-bromo-4-chloroindolyl phosphate hydrolysis protein
MCGLFCYSYFKEKLEEHKDNVNSYNKIELKEYDISLYNPNTNIVSDNNEIEI